MAKIFIIAQNIDIYNDDNLDPFARTGATSANQIYKAGAQGVILGHSEVGDSPDIVRKKFLTITQKEKTPDAHFLEKIILLIGESWEEFKDNSVEIISNIVGNQLADILKDIPQDYLDNLVVGYEPKWGSRGSGHDDTPPPDPKQISFVCKKIHSVLTNLQGKKSTIPIIYGGRSTPERTEEILYDENIEGLILGSACNTVKKTMDIANVMSKVRPGKRKILHANFKAFDLPDRYEEYLSALNTLDDSFIIYLSPCHVDIREIKKII